MRLAMSGLDYGLAPISLRERLSFTKSAVEEMDRRLAAVPGVSGAVLLSTCNRTELYLSCGGEEEPDPGALLCQAALLPYDSFSRAFVTRRGEDCVRHLMEVACGLRSQILGEDQILTQVKTALAAAREAEASDSVLETLFRIAASCGKTAKTGGRLTSLPASAAHQAVEALRSRMGSLEGKRAMVIGNGEMGRLSAKLLRDAGCAVTVTLRSYRHGETVVPSRCMVAPYEERYAAMEGMDLVVSATTSPHYTVMQEPFRAIKDPPKVLIDLAIPRDIQPELASGVTLLNVDDLHQTAGADAAALERVERVVAEHMERFRQWNNYRESLPVLDEVKSAVLDRVRDMDTEDAVCKAIDLLVGGMKEGVSPEALSLCAAKIRAHTRA